jgi:hypothetical protein
MSRYRDALPALPAAFRRGFPDAHAGIIAATGQAAPIRLQADYDPGLPAQMTHRRAGGYLLTPAPRSKLPRPKSFHLDSPGCPGKSIVMGRGSADLHTGPGASPHLDGMVLNCAGHGHPDSTPPVHDPAMSPQHPWVCPAVISQMVTRYPCLHASWLPSAPVYIVERNR